MNHPLPAMLALSASNASDATTRDPPDERPSSSARLGPYGPPGSRPQIRSRNHFYPRHVDPLALAKVCADHFGEPRQDGTSHKVYKTPWQGDPRVNIQRGKDGNAKAYQVRQVLDAIARLEAEKNEESDNDA